MSESDPGQSDITKSIGIRVASDSAGASMGMAGMASYNVDVADLNAINIDTIKPTNKKNVYLAQYKYSRRLYLQRNPNFNNGDGICKTGECPGRLTEENKLFNFMTNPDGCNIDSIVTGAGFLSRMYGYCGNTCSSGTGSDAEIQFQTCTPFDYGSGTPKQNVGDESDGVMASDNAYPCDDDGVVHKSEACAVLRQLPSGYKCMMNEKCTSGVCNFFDRDVLGICQ
jgi:hypothetical protein